VIDLLTIENRKKAEDLEIKKLCVSRPQVFERQRFRYYFDGRRENLFLQVGLKENRVGIAVAEWLVEKVSCVWQIALSADRNAILIPIDEKYDEDLVRSALFLAENLLISKDDILKEVNHPVAKYLELLRFS